MKVVAQPSTPAGAAPHLTGVRFLDAAAVQALGGLTLRARTVADGVLAGLHQSQRHGRSVEFAEHKVYTPGDDTRHIDWKALARFDRYYVKRFLEETSLRAFMAVDTSGSMAYAGGHDRSTCHISKADYARTLAASLACVLLRQSDAVGVMTFAQEAGPRTAIRGGDRQLQEVLDALERAEVGGGTDPVAALSALSQMLSRRALVVAFSDAMESGAALLEPLTALRNRGADVVLFHVLHPDEVEFPFDGVVRFLDLEGDREAQVDAAGLRAAYVEEFERWRQELASQAMQRGIDYHMVRCDQSPAAVLLSFMLQRH